MLEQEVLDKAADLLEKQGWVPYYNGQARYGGPMCVLQALHAVAPWPVAGSAILLLLSRIDDAYISFWNDRQKSIEPVLRALRGA